MNIAFGSLFNGLNKHTQDKGQILISPYELPKGVHYIHSGYVKMYDISASGECQILAIHGSGDFFPLSWSLEDEDQQLFYETMCNTTFSIMPKNDFKEAVYSTNETLKAIIAYLLKSYRFSQLRIQNLEYLTTTERLAFRLIFLATYFGHKVDEKVVIDMPVIYQDLANSINSTRDTVNRVMRQFIDSSIVSRSNHTLTVNSVARLEAELGLTIKLNN
jgi:CRP-like cAMP-binding protein